MEFGFFNGSPAFIAVTKTFWFLTKLVRRGLRRLRDRAGGRSDTGLAASSCEMFVQRRPALDPISCAADTSRRDP